MNLTKEMLLSVLRKLLFRTDRKGKPRLIIKTSGEGPSQVSEILNN